MNSHTSHAFPSLKAIAFLTVAVASAALITPRFVHADQVSVQAIAVVSAPVRAVEQPLSTPASTNYHDGINVAAIAVAAYDHQHKRDSRSVVNLLSRSG